MRAEHGAEARIVSADRLRRGGVGGFFSKQWFELGVEVPDPSAAADSDAPPLDSVEALLALADQADGMPAFGVVLAAAESPVDSPEQIAAMQRAALTSIPSPAPEPTVPDLAAVIAAALAETAALEPAAVSTPSPPAAQSAPVAEPRIIEPLPKVVDTVAPAATPPTDDARAAAVARARAAAKATTAARRTQAEAAPKATTRKPTTAAKPVPKSSAKPGVSKPASAKAAPAKGNAAKRTPATPVATKPRTAKPTAIAPKATAPVAAAPVATARNAAKPAAVTPTLAKPATLRVSSRVEARPARVAVGDVLVALPGRVTVVAGALPQAVAVAEQVIARLRLSPSSLLVAGPAEPGRARRVYGPEHAATIADELRSGGPVVVAVDAPVDLADGAAWAAAIAEALGADALVAVVEATRRPDDLRRHLTELGNVTALAIHGTATDDITDLGYPVLKD